MTRPKQPRPLWRPRWLTALLAVWLLTACGAFGQATFRSLGQLPAPYPFSAAYAISGDGRVVARESSTVLNQDPLDFGGDLFRWTPEGGMSDLGPVSAPYFLPVPEAMSTDGSTIVGGASWGLNPSLGPYLAWRWTAAGGLDELWRQIPYPYSWAFGCSSDGRIVVGSAGIEPVDGYPFRWSAATGMQFLLLDTGYTAAAVRGCSGDAQLMVGWRYPDAARRTVAAVWRQASGWTNLGFLPGRENGSYATSCSADGSVVIGVSEGGSPNSAFRWTAQYGMRNLGLPPGGVDNTRPYACSADGSIIVGQYQNASPARYLAFIWDRRHGIRDLRDVLMNQYGLDLSGWILPSAYAVSADGRSIAGRGGTGTAQAWLATLPMPCDADWDDNGRVTIQDFLLFLRDFATAAPAADMNDDGSVTASDFLDYLARYAAACTG